jgi:hypothetical protein
VPGAMTAFILLTIQHRYIEGECNYVTNDFSFLHVFPFFPSFIRFLLPSHIAFLLSFSLPFFPSPFLTLFFLFFFSLAFLLLRYFLNPAFLFIPYFYPHLFNWGGADFSEVVSKA